MDAYEIIDYIAKSEKKTPVKLYVKEKEAINYGSAKVFGDKDKVVFGDWRELESIIQAIQDKFEDIVIENNWFDRMKNTTLYLYEFDISEFELQDEIAGYYVSKTSQVPIAKYQVSDLFSELIQRNVEIRITDNLWKIADEVKASTLNWSLCRMNNAKPRI